MLISTRKRNTKFDRAAVCTYFGPYFVYLNFEYVRRNLLQPVHEMVINISNELKKQLYLKYLITTKVIEKKFGNKRRLQHL